MKLLDWLFRKRGGEPADLSSHERQIHAIEADWDAAHGEAEQAMRAARRRPSAIALEVRRRGRGAY